MGKVRVKMNELLKDVGKLKKIGSVGYVGKRKDETTV